MNRSRMFQHLQTVKAWRKMWKNVRNKRRWRKRKDKKNEERRMKTLGWIPSRIRHWVILMYILVEKRSKLKIKSLFMVRAIYYLTRSEEHTSELQSRFDLVCRLLLEKKK